MVISRHQIILELKAQTKAFDKAMGNSMTRFKKSFRETADGSLVLNRRLQENRKVAGRLVNRFRLLTGGLRGFRMEMLGVMVFVMGMSRFFSGLVAPALEAEGAFETLNSILRDFFEPTAERVNDLLFTMQDALEGVPVPVREAAGVFAIAGIGIGNLLFSIGMMSLGLNSIIQVFGKARLAALAGFLGPTGLAGLVGLAINFAILKLDEFISKQLGVEDAVENLREELQIQIPITKLFTFNIIQAIKNLLNLTKQLGVELGIIQGKTTRQIEGERVIDVGIKKFFGAPADQRASAFNIIDAIRTVNAGGGIGDIDVLRTPALNTGGGAVNVTGGININNTINVDFPDVPAGTFDPVALDPRFEEFMNRTIERMAEKTEDSINKTVGGALGGVGG